MLEKFPGGRFYTGDCLEIMPTLASGKINMILCDLPYGTTACKWDTIIPFKPLWKQYTRLTKAKAPIVLSAAQPFTTALIASNLKLFRYAMVWDKQRATNFMAAKVMPLLRTEDICVFSKAQCNQNSKNNMTYNPQGVLKKLKLTKNGKNVGGKVAVDRGARFVAGKEYAQDTTNYPNNIIYINNDNNPLHPTQKPVALFEYLIKTYTNPGDIVLDNCAGSGTTAIAAINTGRRWVCIEQDTTYAALAIDRIRKHLKHREAAIFRKRL